MTYEELCNMETELENKQFEFIKSTLAHNNSKVELEILFDNSVFSSLCNY